MTAIARKTGHGGALVLPIMYGIVTDDNIGSTMTTSTIISLAEAKDVDLVGGKAAALGMLIRSGLPVPNGFVVSVVASKEHSARAFKPLPVTRRFLPVPLPSNSCRWQTVSSELHQRVECFDQEHGSGPFVGDGGRQRKGIVCRAIPHSLESQRG